MFVYGFFIYLYTLFHYEFNFYILLFFWNVLIPHCHPAYWVHKTCASYLIISIPSFMGCFFCVTAKHYTAQLTGTYISERLLQQNGVKEIHHSCDQSFSNLYMIEACSQVWGNFVKVCMFICSVSCYHCRSICNIFFTSPKTCLIWIIHSKKE